MPRVWRETAAHPGRYAVQCGALAALPRTGTTVVTVGRTASADTGFVAQNVYLYCATAGLACVVRGLVDRRKLAPALELRVDQRIVLAQTVGYAA